MRIICFELTMPNIGSWNGKWTRQDDKHYYVKTVSNKFFNEHIAKLLNEKLHNDFHYSFGDGWGANVHLTVIDSIEARKRRKISKGFAGYDWMIPSIINHGEIRATKLNIKT